MSAVNRSEHGPTVAEAKNSLNMADDGVNKRGKFTGMLPLLKRVKAAEDESSNLKQTIEDLKKQLEDAHGLGKAWQKLAGGLMQSFIISNHNHPEDEISEDDQISKAWAVAQAANGCGRVALEKHGFGPKAYNTWADSLDDDLGEHRDTDSETLKNFYSY